MLSVIDALGRLKSVKSFVLSLVQGDILYASATDTLSALAKNTSSTRYLSNTGGSNNPAWAQVNLANGVTGSLPVANLVNGVTTVLALSTTGSQNNWAPGISGDTFINWTGASDLTVTGFSSSGVTAGTRLIFSNTSTKNATFSHQSVSSSPGNKLYNTGAVSVIVAPGGYICYVWDGTNWIMFGFDQGAALNWTPADGSGASLTFTVASAKYVLAGNKVFVTFDLAYPVTASGAAAKITGLPFTAGGAAGALSVGFENVVAATSQNVFMYIRASTTNIELYAPGGGALTNVQMTGVTVSAAGCYFI